MMTDEEDQIAAAADKARRDFEALAGVAQIQGPDALRDAIEELPERRAQETLFAGAMLEALRRGDEQADAAPMN